MPIEVAIVEGLATITLLFAFFSIFLKREDHGNIQVMFFILTLFSGCALLGSMYIMALKDTTYTGMSNLILGPMVAMFILTIFMVFYFLFNGVWYYLGSFAWNFNAKKIQTAQERIKPKKLW